MKEEGGRAEVKEAGGPLRQVNRASMASPAQSPAVSSVPGAGGTQPAVEPASCSLTASPDRTGGLSDPVPCPDGVHPGSLSPEGGQLSRF